MSSTFTQAIQMVLHHEGGYACVANDSGGETYCGITRRDHPDWAGWAIIDAVKVQRPLRYNEILHDVALQGMVEALYQEKYWMTSWKDLPQELATELLDSAVNAGQVTAILLLQKALVKAGVRVSVDGVYGDKTFAAICAVELAELMIEFKTEQVINYVKIAEAKPSQKAFVREWVRRAIA